MAEAFVGAQAVLAARTSGFRGDAAAAELEGRSWRQAEAQVRRGMTALVDGDTNGAVERLQTDHPSG